MSQNYLLWNRRERMCMASFSSYGEHVRGMSGHRWDIYSRYILQMLRGLIGFNFYGTVERMNDVIGPMLHAIDRKASRV